MLRGLYTASAGMISGQRRQEMLTNNLTNANTPGYKADRASLRTFPNMLLANLSAQETNPAYQVNNELATGVYLQETIPHFAQGDIIETGKTTDVALLEGAVPDGGVLLFAVETEDGLRYTRNGNFTIDHEGTLVTMQGYRVLDSNGEAITSLVNDDFVIRTDGSLVQDEEMIAQLNVVLANEANLLVKEGNGLFRYDGDEAGIASVVGNDEVIYRVQQKFLERSNVNVEQTMVDMLQAYRTFEINQKVVQAYDQSLEKTVNDIGRL